MRREHFTPFFAVLAGLRVAIVGLRGSAIRAASVGDILRADSTLGSAVSSPSSDHNIKR